MNNQMLPNFCSQTQIFLKMYLFCKTSSYLLDMNIYLRSFQANHIALVFVFLSKEIRSMVDSRSHNCEQLWGETPPFSEIQLFRLGSMSLHHPYLKVLAKMRRNFALLPLH